MNDISDDYDFTPSSNSSLKSLFDNSPDFPENPTLTYTAPKQPKLEAKSQPVKPETSVVFACLVQVWKLTNGKYVSIGKQGLAIIGSSSQNSYEAILYKDKQNVNMRVKLCSDLELTLKKDNSASFYDAARENWLVRFTNKESCDSLISYVEKCGGRVLQPEAKQATAEEESVESKAKNDILVRIAKMGQSMIPNQNHEDTDYQINTKITEISTVPSVLPAPIVQNIPVMTPALPYDPLSIYVAENRAQQSEFRMNLSQISEKLNSIMHIVEGKKLQTCTETDAVKSKVKALELMNENLSKQLSVIQEENIQLKAKLKHQDKEQLEILQDEANQRIVELEKELDVSQKRINELSETLKTQTETLRDTSYTKEKCDKFVGQLKEEMNAMYSRISSSLNDPETGAIIAQNLKSTTMKIIQSFQQLHD